MKNIPDKIYLQIDADGETPEDFNELHGVSWCADRIYPNDIEYVRESFIIPSDGFPMAFLEFYSGDNADTIEQVYNDWLRFRPYFGTITNK
jgi:hypothetical protein